MSKSHGCLPGPNGFFICTQINIASTPDGDGLHKHSFLFASFDIANHIDPGSNLQIVALHALQDMDNLDIGDFCGTGCGVVVFELKGRCWDHIVVNTAVISISSQDTMGARTSPESGPLSLVPLP